MGFALINGFGTTTRIPTKEGKGPNMSRSSRRATRSSRRRRRKQPHQTTPNSPTPDSGGAELLSTPSQHGENPPPIIVDLQLARDMIEGGWATPAEGRLRLIARLIEIADNPSTAPAFRLGAINALTRIDEHRLKSKIAEHPHPQANPLQAALRILAEQATTEPE